MKNGEREFWQRLMQAINPAWDIALNREGDRALNISDQTARVYVVDTSNLWTLMGATSPQEVHRVDMEVRAAQAEGLNALNVAPFAVKEGSDKSVKPGTKQAEELVALALAAITQSQLYPVVLEKTGSAAGHWVYIIYRLKNGDILGRQGFTAGANEALAPDLLLGFVRHLVETDTSSRGKVGDLLAKGGGADLSPALVS
jgi:hypothetical protein